MNRLFKLLRHWPIFIIILMIASVAVVTYYMITTVKTSQIVSEKQVSISRNTGSRCNVSVVELDGHKYILAVHPNGIAICPAVNDRTAKE